MTLKANKFLYGINPVERALQAGARHLIKLYIREGTKSDRLSQLVHLAKKNSLPVQPLSQDKLTKYADGSHHQGVVLECDGLPLQNLKQFVDNSDPTAKSLLIALDQIEDPQNVGAIIRSASFLKADGIISLKRNAAPLSPACSKASAGAMESFPIIEVANLANSFDLLKQAGYVVIGARLEDSIPFTELPHFDRVVLVMGNEGKGLRELTEKRCDYLTHIPGGGDGFTLNVSAAASILIHHFVNPK